MGKITGTFDDRAWSQERTGEFECRRYLVLEKFGGRSSGRGLLMYDSCLAVKQAQRRCIPVKKRPKGPPKVGYSEILTGKRSPHLPWSHQSGQPGPCCVVIDQPG